MVTAAPEILTTPKTSSGRVMLPYQEAWRRDESRLKICEKSRRIGMTYVEANDATMSRLEGRPRERFDYWFTSADESAAYEFADYCRFWREKAEGVADKVREEEHDDESTGKKYTAFVIRFAHCKITAMTSNPRRLRSKGGDIGCDEFAYHDDPKKLYEAASPCILWGGRIRILSTHNGEENEFYKFCQMGKRHANGNAKPGDIPFSLHSLPITVAVEQGLVEKINATRGTNLTREQFLAECRAMCRSQEQYDQEFGAIASSESSAWLPYDLIEKCESDLAGDVSRYTDGQRYIGMDIGENGDRTIICTLERVGDVLWVREIVIFTDEYLSVKQDALLVRLKHPRVVRACVDATGVGTQIAQEAAKTGKGEGIKFTLPAKDQLASPLRSLFEDQRIRVPADRDVREDLHKVRMVRTINGHPRFDAARTKDGHADRFWALALANHAAANVGPQPMISYGSQ